MYVYIYMCMVCIYTYIYTIQCIYVDMYTCVYMYTYTYMCICVHTYTHCIYIYNIHTYICICVYIYTHIYTYMYTYIHTYLHYTLVYMHSVHIYVHMCIVYICIHTQVYSVYMCVYMHYTHMYIHCTRVQCVQCECVCIYIYGLNNITAFLLLVSSPQVNLETFLSYPASLWNSPYMTIMQKDRLNLTNSKYDTSSHHHFNFDHYCNSAVLLNSTGRVLSSHGELGRKTWQCVVLKPPVRLDTPALRPSTTKLRRGEKCHPGHRPAPASWQQEFAFPNLRIYFPPAPQPTHISRTGRSIFWMLVPASRATGTANWMGTGRRLCCRNLHTRYMGSSSCHPPLPAAESPGTSTYGLLLQDGLKPEGIDKDIWLHQKMKHTNYLTEYDLSEFENIGAIGLELWQVTWF